MRTEELLALGLFDRGSRVRERIEMLLARGRESGKLKLTTNELGSFSSILHTGSTPTGKYALTSAVAIWIACVAVSSSADGISTDETH